MLDAPPPEDRGLPILRPPPGATGTDVPDSLIKEMVTD